MSIGDSGKKEGLLDTEERETIVLERKTPQIYVYILELQSLNLSGPEDE